jgi:hypothetical protein
MMKQVKLSHAEALKMELMERYSLREDQVAIEINFKTTDLELGRQILADFSKYDEKDRLPEGQNCDSVFGKQVHSVSVHRKDGFYGQYLFDDKEDDNE